MLPFARKQKDKENWLFTGDSRDPHYILYCLELARDLRVCLHLDFFLNKHSISQLRSVCVKVDRQRLVVCLLEEVPRLPPAGMETQVYFTVRGGRRNVPCNFTTKLEALHSERGSQYMTFPMPDYMGHNQRRHNVRIAMSKEDIPGFSVWHGSLASGNAPSGVPGLRWTQLEEESFQLQDLSAGGLCLDVQDTCREYARLLPKELLLIKGDFALPDKPPLPLALVGSIVRINVSERRRTKSLAVRFQRWLQARDNRNFWLKVDEQDGVPSIGVWIFQLLLERNRLLKKT